MASIRDSPTSRSRLTEWTSGSSPGRGKLTARQASAIPYTGYIALRFSPLCTNLSMNSRMVFTDIGSAPL
ncbi:hypothetical protein D3C73_546750 [compost metagenome]